MRIFVVALFLVGCRTQPIELVPDPLFTPQAQTDLSPVDAQTLDSSVADLGEVRDAGRCGRDDPNGLCPQGQVCCAFDCWGGSDEKGWCFSGSGCPAC